MNYVDKKISLGSSFLPSGLPDFCFSLRFVLSTTIARKGKLQMVSSSFVRKVEMPFKSAFII
jgi:hypothetical protein